MSSGVFARLIVYEGGKLLAELAGDAGSGTSRKAPPGLTDIALEGKRLDRESVDLGVGDAALSNRSAGTGNSKQSLQTWSTRGVAEVRNRWRTLVAAEIGTNS